MSWQVWETQGYEPDRATLEKAAAAGAEVQVTHDLCEAVSGADVVYTDVWASMGKKQEEQQRAQAFKALQVGTCGSCGGPWVLPGAV